MQSASSPVHWYALSIRSRFEKKVDGLLRAEGVESFARENGRVFPRSGRADDVVAALLRRAQHAGAVVRLNARVSEVLQSQLLQPISKHINQDSGGGDQKHSKMRKK